MAITSLASILIGSKQQLHIFVLVASLSLERWGSIPRTHGPREQQIHTGNDMGPVHCLPVGRMLEMPQIADASDDQGAQGFLRDSGD